MAEGGDRWYLFGAQAVQVWGTPRLTADVDVTASLRSTPERLVSRLRQAGFDLRIRDVNGFVRKTRVLPFVHRRSAIPLDVVLAGPGLEEEFLARARRVAVEGVVVPVISPEDLIVTKALAGRAKDVEDVRGILRERLGTLDLRRIRSRLRLLEKALADSEPKALFERELASVRAASRRRLRRAAPRRRRRSR